MPRQSVFRAVRTSSWYETVLYIPSASNESEHAYIVHAGISSVVFANGETCGEGRSRASALLVEIQAAFQQVGHDARLHGHDKSGR